MHRLITWRPLLRGVILCLLLSYGFGGVNQSSAASASVFDPAASQTLPIHLESATGRLENGRLELSVSSGSLAGVHFSIQFAPNDQINEAFQLLGSTYLGGSTWDSAHAVAVDSAGAIYIAGETPAADFPFMGGFGNPTAQQLDAFIVKLAPGGTAVEYAALLGGGSLDSIAAIQVENGIVYLAGETWSRTFPAGYAVLGENDVWAAAITPDGAGLIYAVRFGGSDQDRAAGLAVQDGRVTLTGITWSANFPLAAASGNGDLFLAQLSPTGILENAAVYGGSDVDSGFDLDWRDEQLVVCGETWSRNFPIRGLQGQDDGFVMLLDENLTMLGGTLIGGNSEDSITGCGFTADGKILTVGRTASSNLAGAEGLLQGAEDAFIARLSLEAAVESLVLLGGSDVDSAQALAIAPDGLLWVTGTTKSVDFPATSGAHQGAVKGGVDAFLAGFNPSGLTIGPVYATLLGGSNNDFAKILAVNPGGMVVVAGYSQSPDFPIVGSPLQGSLNGSQDAFISWFGVAAEQQARPTATSQPAVPTGTPAPTLSESEISAAETAAAPLVPSETPQVVSPVNVETEETVVSSPEELGSIDGTPAGQNETSAAAGAMPTTAISLSPETSGVDRDGGVAGWILGGIAIVAVSLGGLLFFKWRKTESQD